MTNQGSGPGAGGKGEERMFVSPSIRESFPRATRHAPLALSSLSLLIILWGFAQTDLAVTQYVRTVDLDWLVWLGDFGYILGGGWTLVGISAVLLTIGLAAGRQTFRDAGLYSLASHALAGLFAQLFKRLAGRPRPRLTHGDPFQFAPAFDAGLDSFPSGHATASFAVAAVLARSFPAGAWVFYALAGFVAVSRVARGSHFPTDAVVGSVLGLVIGLAVAAPRGQKWRTIRESIVVFTICVACVFSLVWVALHSTSHPFLDQWAFLAGFALVLAAAATRVARLVTSRPTPAWLPSLPLTHAVLAVGLALSTASPTVLVLGALAGAALWLGGWGASVRAANPGPKPLYVSIEIALLVGLVLLLVVMHQARGILPLL